MFGLSISEIGVVFLVLLLVFGPDKLPELANNIGKVMGMLKKQSDALRREFYNSVYKPADDFQNRIIDSGRNLIVEDDLLKKVNFKNPLCPDSKPPTPTEENKATASAGDAVPDDQVKKPE